MCNLMITRKMISCFLPIANIDKINLCVVGIEEHLIHPRIYLSYFIHLYFIVYLGQKHFNISKSVLYIKKLAVGLLIIPNRSIIIGKKSLAIVTPSIKLNQVMSGIYNIGSLNMKMLTIMNI